MKDSLTSVLRVTEAEWELEIWQVDHPVYVLVALLPYRIPFWTSLLGWCWRISTFLLEMGGIWGGSGVHGLCSSSELIPGEVSPVTYKRTHVCCFLCFEQLMCDLKMEEVTLILCQDHITSWTILDFLPSKTTAGLIGWLRWFILS